MSASTYYDDGEYVIRTLGAGNRLYLFPGWSDCSTSDEGVAFGDRDQTIAALRRIVEAMEADAAEDEA